MVENEPSDGDATSRRNGWPRLRRFVGAVAFGMLLLLLPGENPLLAVRGSLATLRASAGLDLRARRLAGRGPAYDRRFFESVMVARDALPSGSQGVALYAPAIPEWGGIYLAIYYFAPIPVVSAPSQIPAGWVAVVYGRDWPARWRLLRALPGGALLDPLP